jgi:hypothetical protein
MNILVEKHSSSGNLHIVLFPCRMTGRDSGFQMFRVSPHVDVVVIRERTSASIFDCPINQALALVFTRD